MKKANTSDSFSRDSPLPPAIPFDNWVRNEPVKQIWFTETIDEDAVDLFFRPVQLSLW